MKYCQKPTPQNTLRRRLTTYFVALTGACLAMLPQGLYASDSLSFPVPIEIEVPAGHRRFLRSHAVGTQNYMCLPFPIPSPSPSGYAWTLVGPQATLFNANRAQIITHFLSPNLAPLPPKPEEEEEEEGTPRATWLDSQDTSVVWAKMIASSPAPAPSVAGSGAIPWLLLEVVGAGAGPTGGHRLTGTTYIQRVNTKGGLAPIRGCDRDNVGVRKFIEYEADYIFYKAT